jgi:hypothetical protein
MTAGSSPEEWVARPVEVQLTREPESSAVFRDPSAASALRGWLEGVSEYGLMLRLARSDEGDRTESIADRMESITFYPWAQVRSVRQVDPETIPS